MGRIKRVIQIDKDKCVECGECKEICSKINYPKLCSGCGKCVAACPFEAIKMVEQTNDKESNKIINNKTHKTMKKRGFGHAIMILIVFSGFSAVVMLLWNAILPDIFGIASINYWQALGLLVLSHILFGGMSAGIMKHAHRNNHNSIRDKWMEMTPEQRQEFIDKRRHFGFGKPFDRYRFDMDEHKETDKKND